MKSGIAGILIVALVGGISFLLAFTASILGIGELDLGYLADKGGYAFYLADGCGEEALGRLRKDWDYSGGSITIGDGSCDIMISGMGAKKNILITATHDNYFKKLELQVTPLPNNSLELNLWRESDA